MSIPPKRNRVLPLVAAALFAAIVAFVWKNGAGSLHRVPAWTVSAIKLKLSLRQDPSAGAYYDNTAAAPLPLATVVQEMRENWPKESVAVIHHAALEVGTALLHRSDIEIGEIVDGKFVPSDLPPWHANQKMLPEVSASPSLFENDQVYVFRRK